MLDSMFSNDWKHIRHESLGLFGSSRERPQRNQFQGSEGRLSRGFLCPKPQRNQFHRRRDSHGGKLPLKDPRPLPRSEKRRGKQKKMVVAFGIPKRARTSLQWISRVQNR
ncbi:hypothetical protein FF1_026158 [Malus domestica]